MRPGRVQGGKTSRPPRRTCVQLGGRVRGGVDQREPSIAVIAMRPFARTMPTFADLRQTKVTT